MNGNEFEDYDHTIKCLKTMTNLKSLYINLHMEEQVDLVMRTLDELEELNGLPVERDLIDGEGEGEDAEGEEEEDDLSDQNS